MAAGSPEAALETCKVSLKLPAGTGQQAAHGCLHHQHPALQHQHPGCLCQALQILDMPASSQVWEWLSHNMAAWAVRCALQQPGCRALMQEGIEQLA